MALRGGHLRNPGRPTLLSEVEEECVLNAVKELRGTGCVVDKEVLIILAQEAMRAHRGDAAHLPEVSHNWVHSFRRRNELSKLKKSSTDRTPLTAAETVAVNAWREELNAVCLMPSSFGIAWNQPLEPEMILVADETPLQYFPQTRGTFTQRSSDGNKAVYISGGDKRQITVTPVVSASGTVPVMQVIWRGKTTRCMPSSSGAHPSIFQTHAEKKCQTRATWSSLLTRIQRYAVEQRNVCDKGPVLLVCDNAPSHFLPDGMVQLGRHPHL